MRRILTLLFMFSLSSQAECLKQDTLAITPKDMGNLTALMEHSAIDVDKYVYDETHAGDNRKVRSSNSPEWLAAVGKLGDHCTANLVGNDPEENSRIVTTAYHCIDEYLSSNKKISITFTTNSGKKIQRNAKVLRKGDIAEDRAILILDEIISHTEISPLVLSDLDPSTHKTVTFAGHSADTGLGQKGKALTYDNDCKFDSIGGRTSENQVWFTNCSAYGGASGGAVVYTEVSEEYGPTHYIVGHIDESTKKGEAVAYGYFDKYYSNDNFFAQIVDASDEYNSYDD